MPDTLHVCVRACVRACLLVCMVCMRAGVYRPMGLRCSEANAHRAALQHARGPRSSQVYSKAWSRPRAPSSAALCAFMDAPMCSCWLCYARMLLCVLPPPPPTPAHPRPPPRLFRPDSSTPDHPVAGFRVQGSGFTAESSRQVGIGDAVMCVCVCVCARARVYSVVARLTWSSYCVLAARSRPSSRSTCICIYAYEGPVNERTHTRTRKHAHARTRRMDAHAYIHPTYRYT